MALLLGMLSKISNIEKLSDSDYEFVVNKFNRHLIALDNEDLKYIVLAIRNNQYTVDDVLKLFKFATTNYNANRENVPLGIGCGRMALIMRQLIEDQSISSVQIPNLMGKVNAPLERLLYRYPDLNTREMTSNISQFETMTLMNYLYATGSTSNRKLLDLKFPQFDTGQLLSQNSVDQWSKVLQFIESNKL